MAYPHAARIRRGDARARHTVVRTAAARHRNRGHRRCRSVDPRPCRRRRGGRGRRAGDGLASDRWHPVVCRRDLRSEFRSRGHRRGAHGPCRHGGRGRGFGCGSIHRGAC
eukprot:scaffold15134_cov66-Phaeocystis_antarctica.AAC.3